MTRRAILLAFSAALLASTAYGYIYRLYPLKQIIKESAVIAEGVIEKVDPERKTMTIKVTASLKGQMKAAEMNVNIGVGQMWHPEAMMRHAVVKAPVVIFSDARGACLIYLNHFFFQVFPGRGGSGWYNLTHIEAYMNRTYDGPVADLNKAVREALSGRPAPTPDPRKKPMTKEILAALPTWAPGAKGGWGENASGGKPEPKKFEPDAEGFLRNWLLLDPISLGRAAERSNEAAQKEWFDKEWFPGQFKATPKPGQKARIGAGDLAWHDYPAWDYYTDIEGFAVEKDKSQFNSLYLGFVYIFCEKEIAGVALSIGSDEGCCFRLNGEDILRTHKMRKIGKDQDKSQPLTLKQGMNVLQVAMVNGTSGLGDGGLNGFSARFLGPDSSPVRDYVHDSAPTRPGGK
jgi:hypothetical protein